LEVDLLKRLVLLAAMCAAILCGCGKSAAPSASPAPSQASPQSQTTEGIPPAKIVIPPETSRTPEGARGADRSHYLNGEPAATLTGSAIRIDAAGAQLIEGFENVYEARYCPFWDPYGKVWTRAFGETDWSGDFGGVCISHAKAEANVRVLVEDDYQYAVRGLGMNLGQGQVDALDDFVWNLGAGIFVGELRAQIERREWSAILAYDRASGEVLSGLVKRRQAEYRLLIATPPKPAPSLTTLERTRETLARLEAAHHCRQPPYHAAKPTNYEHACNVWIPQGRTVDREIKAKGGKL
jgi:GH24 family phage-related lysozyme (muramidase)